MHQQPGTTHHHPAIALPTGFFERDFLEQLRDTVFPVRQAVSSTDWMSQPRTLEALVACMQKAGIDPRAQKTLDLGSGYGYVLAAFALHCCPIYGVDHDDVLLKRSRHILATLPLHRQPEAMHHDYYNDSLWLKHFDDGTRPHHIDFFYCYPYSYNHARAMLVRTLAGHGKARRDSVAFLGYAWNSRQNDADLSDKDLLRNAGFAVIDVGAGHISPLLRKVSCEPVSGALLEYVHRD